MIFYFENREDIAKVTIEIDNLVITNLATFETKVAHLDIEQLSLELELTIADLRVGQSSFPVFCSKYFSFSSQLRKH